MNNCSAMQTGEKSLQGDGAEKLFHYNLMMVATCGYEAKMGTISSARKQFLQWKDPYPQKLEAVGGEASSQQVLIEGLFNREKLP